MRLFFSAWLAFAEIQLIERVTVALKQLSFFDGEVTMTGNPRG